METFISKDLLKTEAAKFGVDLDEKALERFDIYAKLLVEWNEKINLTAITEENDIITKHFVDSLTIAKYFDANSKIIDVGTGAGFPGIPLKISNISFVE